MIDDTADSNMALLVLHKVVILVMMGWHVATAWSIARPVGRGRTASAAATVIGTSATSAQLDALDRVLHPNAQVVVVVALRSSHVVMSEWELAHFGMLRVLRRSRRLINDTVRLECTD